MANDNCNEDEINQFNFQLMIITQLTINEIKSNVRAVVNKLTIISGLELIPLLPEMGTMMLIKLSPMYIVCEMGRANERKCRDSHSKSKVEIIERLNSVK